MSINLPASFSGYRAMWIVAMFDLPTESKKDKERYRLFRKALLEDGFHMMQYSVYARFCATEEVCRIHKRRVRDSVPEYGEVRILTFTDKQFGMIETYVGRSRMCPEKPPDQLLLF